MSAFPILAQAVEMEPETAGSLLRQLIQPGNMPFLVGIVAIVGWVIVSVVRSVIVHRERLAKIERGIDPDVIGVSSEPSRTEAPLDVTHSYDSK